MKAIFLLGLFSIGSCASGGIDTAAATYEAAAVHAHAIAIRARTEVSPTPTPSPALRCHGTKKITHGDGHTTDCPGCVDCQAKQISRVEPVESIDALLRPAHLVHVTRVQAEASEPFAVVTEESEECACTEATGSCACAPRAKPTAGSCANGACASSQGGPIRKLVKARPLQRVRGFFRERRPLRRLFGRAFCRGCG